MRYRIFAQASAPGVAIEDVITRGGDAFELLDVTPVSDAPLPCLRAGVRRRGTSDAPMLVTVLCRFRRDDDLAEAQRAALQGRAAGMDALAERCPTVIEVVPGSPVDERLCLELCAAIAAVTLGPILPPGGETLLGVRSARLRARG